MSAMDFSAGFDLTINGRAVHTDATIAVINPADGEVFAHAADASGADLDAAVAAAKAAFPAWRDTPITERKRLLVEASRLISENTEAFVALFTREQGRPLAFARMEIMFAAYWLGAAAELDLPVEVVEDTEARRVEVHHAPLGVVCAIVPWNVPFLLAIWKIAPALLAGNTLVVKPSPYTPLCLLKLGELLRGVLPDGVLNIISGGDALGPMMTAHPGFAKISFTGSTATGKRVMETAARSLARVTLELGGNDAAIVMPDVDIDAIIDQLFLGAFYNSAQVCTATKRMYIHADIYDAVRDRLHAVAQQMTVGDGTHEGVTHGPIQNLAQYRRVMAFLDEARTSGLTLLQGKDVPEKGYFVPITIVDNPPEDARVVTEEVFGPILPLLRFSDVEDVIARVNDSQYGLAGAVWAKDIDKAVEIGKRLETGTVWINTNFQNTPFAPFAGSKQSGIGVENGTAGLLEFTQPKTIFIPKLAIAVSA